MEKKNRQKRKRVTRFKNNDRIKTLDDMEFKDLILRMSEKKKTMRKLNVRKKQKI